MVCLWRNRRALPAPRTLLRIRGTVIFLGQTIFLACWMTLLACGTGWTRPRPYRGRYWTAVGWYQAPRRAWGNGGGYRSAPQGRPLPPQRDQQHLGQWLRQHQNMSSGAQERALRNEPGFNRLSPTSQKRLFNRLQQLDSMPPAQRARTLDRVEAWERLSPGQRQQVRNGIQQVDHMPMARQQMMHRAIRDLSEFPPAERPSILNSPQFRYRYSDHERQILETLMLAQPYTPLRSR